MPHNLIVILAPKSAFINKEGAISFRIVETVKDTAASENNDDITCTEKADAKSSQTIKKGQGNAFNDSLMPSKDSEAKRKSMKTTTFSDPRESMENCANSVEDLELGLGGDSPPEVKQEVFLEYLNGNITSRSDDIVQEVNVLLLLEQTLSTLYKQDYLLTRPSIVHDSSTYSVQVTCLCEKGQDVDMIIARLGNIGVGSLLGSVNVLALESSKLYVPPVNAELEASKDKEKALNNESLSQSEKEEESLFMEMASQIRVEQVVELIKAASAFTFDYLSLLLIASTIAGVGLAVNSVVAIVASMLVSPIMGPVVALTFGTVIRDWNLMKSGLACELLSLSICVVVGFIIGIIAAAIGTDGLWPTSEMSSRGMLDGLAIGFAIAVPSGVGVALSVLGNNTNSLVGVAISASLLPPAVNCGMALAYAAVGFYIDPDVRHDKDATDKNSFTYIGLISLTLTLVNIGAIYLSAYGMFRMKEVAPIQNKTAFWQQDIQVSRRINNNRSRENAMNPVGINGVSYDALQQELKHGRSKHLLQDIIGNQTTIADAMSTTNTLKIQRTKRPEVKPTLLDLFRDDDSAPSSPVKPRTHHQHQHHLSVQHPVQPPPRNYTANRMTPNSTLTMEPQISNLSDIRARFKQQAHPASFMLSSNYRKEI